MTLHEEVTLAAAAGDPEIGFARLAGTVHDTTHHRDLQRDVARLERGLRGRRDTDHVDLGATARRARDEVETLALAQPERLEQHLARLRLFHRIGGEREPDRVADAFGEQRRDPGDRLDQTLRHRTRFGDTEMQRMIGRLRQQPVRSRS